MSKYIKLDDAIGIITEHQGIRGDTFKALHNAYAIEVSEEELKGCNKVDKRFSEDAISKAYLEQAIENQVMVVNDEYWRGWNNALDKVVELIEGAPSVIPKPKEGEWIYGEHDVAMCDGYRCDRCGFFVPWDYEHKLIDFIKDYNFCPNCGAKMKGADDEP